MTLRDLFAAYAVEIPVIVGIYDKTNSVYCLEFKFENAAGHDYEIFEKYSNALVREWYIGLRMLHVELDIEKF